MKRSEVWRVDLPKLPGHVQAGIRPAVVVQDNQVGGSLPTTLLVPFTSRLTTTRFAGTLVVKPDGVNGLTVPSVALAFRLRAVDRNNFIQPMGVLDARTLDQILDLIERLSGR